MSEGRIDRLEVAMIDLAVSVKELTSTMTQFMVTESARMERDKHQESLNDTITAHMKKSEPLLIYVADQKAASTKVKSAIAVAVTLAILGLLGFSFK